MALLRWAPFDLATEDVDDLVRRTFGDFGSSLLANRTQWTPPLDAFVEGEELHVRIELPGIDPDNDVEIEVENDVLHISGERRQDKRTEQNGEGSTWFKSERFYGRFDRRIALPEGVDAEGVRAGYEAGVLDVAVPLPTKPKKKVKVNIGQKQLEA